jgi:nicotinamidase-related amidase
MSSVIYLKALSDPSLAPCLVLVDMQQEYVAGDRLMAVPGAKLALDNCRSALSHARSKGFPIAFLRQVSQSPYFNANTRFSGWIDGFEPTRTDMVFDRNKPSCYSNKFFAELMENSGGHFVIAGFAGETACLSTAIDAYHRNHRFMYLADASASHGLNDLTAASVHNAVTTIIQVYGEVLDTASWIKSNSKQVVVLEG